MPDQMESAQKISDRHDAEGLSIAVIKEHIIGLQRVVEMRLTQQDHILADIKVQTTKTNGTVGDIQKWRERATGGMVIASSIFLPFVIGIITYLLYLHIK